MKLPNIFCLLSLFFFFQLAIQAQEVEMYQAVEPKYSYPVYPGGKDGLCQFFTMNMKVPYHLVKKGENAKVIVSCIIKRLGDIGDVDIIYSEDSLCDDEAKRVVKDMPKWLPKGSYRPVESSLLFFTFYFVVERGKVGYDKILSWRDTVLIDDHIAVFAEYNAIELPSKRIQRINPILIVDIQSKEMARKRKKRNKLIHQN